MFTINYLYLFTGLVLTFVTIPLNVIIILITLLLSIILGITIYLDSKLPNIESDYNVFKENKAICFIEDETKSRLSKYGDYLRNCIENNKIELIECVEYNRKFTNQHYLDSQLNDVLQLIIQDFVQPWYQSISFTQEFPTKLYLFLNYTISAFAKRIKNIDMTNFLTNKLLDELIKHNRLYRLTKTQLSYRSFTDDELVSTFFSNERKMEKTFSREKLCLDSEEIYHFFDQLCDLLQYILFPYNSFNNETFRLFTKGILVKVILIPMFNLLSEPDFINGLLISISKSNLPSTEIFIAILQSIDDPKELNAVLDSVEQEILLVRSKDHTDDETKMKQQLGSLIYLKKYLQSQLKKLEDYYDCCDGVKSFNDSLNAESETLSEKPSESGLITFESILNHSGALEYFMEYMSNINAESYINFFINAEAFKISVEQGVFEIYLSSLGDGPSDEQNQQMKQLVLEAAMNIYDTYLSPLAPNRLHMIDENYCDRLREQLSSNDPSTWITENLFGEIFARVREIILTHDKFLPAFKRNKHYMKQIESLLLHESNNIKDQLSDDSPNSDIDKLSTDGLPNIEENPEQAENKSETFSNGFTIEIVETGMLNEHGKTFVAYLINVEQPGEEKRVILRRYSEFYEFHHLLLEKSEKYHFDLNTILSLPPKTVLGNRTNRHFIQYRKCMLNIYLKKLPFLYDQFTFVRDEIEAFLHPGHYIGKHSDRADGSASSAMRNGRFNPIKTISNAMKNSSENIMDGFQKLSRTLSLQPDASTNRVAEKKPNTITMNQNIRPSTINDPYQHQTQMNDVNRNDVNSNCDKISIDDNVDFSDEVIPLLSLLDEVFDLKNQSFWFRRRIIELFKQFVEVTYSDMISRKITDFIEEWTSPNAVAEYINIFKNSFWPNGQLAVYGNRKPEDILRRKVATKALLLTSLNDLKKVIGNETLQSGLLSFFDLFQHQKLNRRLVLVIFELLLKEIFPDNYFDEIFNRLYSKHDNYQAKQQSASSSNNSSPEHVKQSDWPPHLSKFIARI